VSRAVKLMVAHEENLKMQHHRNVAELQEVKKRVQQQNSSKTVSHPRASPGLWRLVLFVLLGRHVQRLTEFLVLDPEESDSRKKNSHQVCSQSAYCLICELFPFHDFIICFMFVFFQNSGVRYRVSTTLIPSQIQVRRFLE